MTTYVTTPLHYYKYIMVQNKYLYKYSFMPLIKALVEKDIVTLNRLFDTTYSLEFGCIFKCTSLDLLTKHMLPTTPNCCDFVESEFDNIASILLTAKTEVEWQQIVLDIERTTELNDTNCEIAATDDSIQATTIEIIDNDAAINDEVINDAAINDEVINDAASVEIQNPKRRQRKSKHAN